MADRMRQKISGDGNIVSGSGDITINTLQINNSPKEVVRPPLAHEPTLCTIPGGPFLMGTAATTAVPPWEAPQHQVDLPEFAISQTPITNSQYQAFIQANTQAPPKHWSLNQVPPGLEEHPITQVSWQDALAYCQWLSQQSGRFYRLPTEAEWEKAARSSDGRTYPWGRAWQEGYCNCNGPGTTPVTAFPNGASPYACLDMLGNVREWTSTIWGASPAKPDFPYPYQHDGRETVAPTMGPVYRVFRGGCYRDQASQLRCTMRGFAAENSRVDWCGFRIVMEGQACPV